MGGPRLAFYDTETNGLLADLDKLHCLGVELAGEYLNCADQPGYLPIASGLKALETADIRVAHNGVDFDERAVRKCYPGFKPKEGSRVIDTLILSRLLFARIASTGPNTHKCPPQLRTRHSLKALGYRLGEHKQEFDGGDWQTWTPQMSEYMGGDIKTLKRVFVYMMSRKPSPQAVEIEHNFARIMARQEAWGFTFNRPAAERLADTLHKMEAEMEAKLVSRFGEWWGPGQEVIVKKSRKVKMLGFPDVTIRRFGAKGKELKPYVGPPFIEYDEGARYTPVERTVFNPKSRDHVRLKLQVLYGWKPSKFTKKTEKDKYPTPTIDDEVLRQLPWPEAQILADYYTVLKIIGYLSSGKNAWLALVKDDNKIHGRVITIGTYTHRCAHMSPNMGQIPAVHKNSTGGIKYGLEGGFGSECRGLFTATPGFVLVGTDAAGIQLRLFGHYLAKYDGGEYARIVDKEDPHAWLRDIVGTDILGGGGEGREKGKTIGYARLLGGGDKRLGEIAAPLEKLSEQKKVGKHIRERLAERFKAEVLLKEDVTTAVNQRGYIMSLDGRRVDVLKAHTGLATLLQAGEAVVMKQAIYLLDTALKEKGWQDGVDEAGRVRDISKVDYEFVASVHDEQQTDVRPHLVDIYMEVANGSIVRSGEILKLKCPLRGESKMGTTWLETH